MRAQKVYDYILKNSGHMDVGHAEFIATPDGLLVSIPINKSNFSRGFYKWFSLIDEVDTILDWLRDHDWGGVRFCSECGRPMNSGYTTDEGDVYICTDCFDDYCEREQLTPVKDDECGGYYIDADGNGTGIYYTEWE